MSDDRKPVPPALTKLLSAWEHGAKLGYGAVERQTHCGGALLFVSRAEGIALGAMNAPGAIRWKYDPEGIPDDGQRHSWRVSCGGEVRPLKNGNTAGLCSRCEGSEQAMRTKAAERKESANLSAKRETSPRSRRGNFDR